MTTSANVPPARGRGLRIATFGAVLLGAAALTAAALTIPRALALRAQEQHERDALAAAETVAGLHGAERDARIAEVLNLLLEAKGDRSEHADRLVFASALDTLRGASQSAVRPNLTADLRRVRERYPEGSTGAATLDRVLDAVVAQARAEWAAHATEREARSAERAARAALERIVPPAAGQWVVEHRWYLDMGDGEVETWTLRWIDSVDAEGHAVVLEQRLAAADAATAVRPPQPVDTTVTALPTHAAMAQGSGLELHELTIAGRPVTCLAFPPTAPVADYPGLVPEAEIRTFLYTPELGVNHVLATVSRLEAWDADGRLVRLQEIVGVGAAGGGPRPVAEPAGPAQPPQEDR